MQHNELELVDKLIKNEKRGKEYIVSKLDPKRCQGLAYEFLINFSQYNYPYIGDTDLWNKVRSLIAKWMDEHKLSQPDLGKILQVCWDCDYIASKVLRKYPKSCTKQTLKNDAKESTLEEVLQIIENKPSKPIEKVKTLVCQKHPLYSGQRLGKIAKTCKTCTAIYKAKN